MKDGLIKRTVAQRLFPNGSVRTILLGPSRGMKVRVSHASGRAVLVGYDRPSQQFLTRRIHAGATVFDVGANCGQYALLLAKLVGPSGRVVACEPATAIFKELRANIDLNGLTWVHCEQAAVARAVGILRFYSSPDDPTMGKIEGADPAISSATYTVGEVASTTIDVLAERWGQPSVVKIDTEGAAGYVLAGAPQTVATRGTAFLIEVHGPVERSAVESWAIEARYTISNLEGRPVEHLGAHHVSPVWLEPAGSR